MNGRKFDISEALSGPFLFPLAAPRTQVPRLRGLIDRPSRIHRGGPPCLAGPVTILKDSSHLIISASRHLRLFAELSHSHFADCRDHY